MKPSSTFAGFSKSTNPSNVSIFDYLPSDSDNVTIQVLDPITVKRDMKERNKELDSLLKNYEELNNKVNEIAISKGCELSSDPVKNLISEYNARFDRKK